MNKKVPCSIQPDDPLQLQFNLMAENLVRSNLGKVWHKHLLLSHPAKGITTMREILRLLSLEGYNVLVSNDRYDFRSFLVFEDIGDILTIKAYQEYIDVKSNLLNISEGFLSLLMDTIILVSFNYDIKNIDPAVLRPGRCLANINVGLLPYNHARKLVSFDIPEKDYSLAEIYELRKQNKEAR